MDIDRLNKAIGTYDTAQYIFSLDNGETLKKCLEIAEAANAGVNVDAIEEESGDPLSLKNALKNSPNARTQPNIVLGVNKTKVNDTRVAKPKDGTKAFQSAADRVTKIASSMSEDQITDHRAVNSSGELCWIKRKATAGQIDSVKKAALKSIQHQKEIHIVEKSAFSVNEQAQKILKDHAASKLQEALTPAQRTILAKPSASVGRTPAPDADVAIHMPSYSDTQSHFPPEFAAKQKAGVVDQWTKAASTIKRPTDIGFIDTKNLDQGNIAANRPEARPASAVGKNEGKNTLPQYRNGKANNGEPQQFPRKPQGGAGSNIESGRGYY
jgi:hypothetical protein